ncbi:unnamed protein product, partial [Polarella glacialis]
MDFAPLWRSFAGETGELLLSLETKPMRRFAQMANLNFRGTWLDVGEDDSERYRFLTTMREVTGSGPLERSLEAISYFTEREAKVSHVYLSGAVYLGYERFMEAATSILSQPLNIASGILDLRQPQRPRVFGTWLQYNPLPDSSRRRSAARGRGRGWSL